jgi:hypothetical protein
MAVHAGLCGECYNLHDDVRKEDAAKQKEKSDKEAENSAKQAGDTTKKTKKSFTGVKKLNMKPVTNKASGSLTCEVTSTAEHIKPVPDSEMLDKIDNNGVVVSKEVKDFPDNDFKGVMVSDDFKESDMNGDAKSMKGNNVGLTATPPEALQYFNGQLKEGIGNLDGGMGTRIQRELDDNGGKSKGKGKYPLTPGGPNGSWVGGGDAYRG